jgi:4-hydroxybenzoate polyprenyltransferase
MHLIKNIEKNKFSFQVIFFYIFSIIFIRHFLDMFSDIGRSNFSLGINSFLLHHPLFFLVMIISSTLILHLIIKEKISKTLNFVISIFPLILLAPFIDLILFKGANLDYILINSWSELLPYLQNLFNFNINQPGVTPGMLTWSLLFVLSASYYVYYKTKNLSKTIISFILNLVLGILLAILPSLLNIIAKEKLFLPSTIFTRVYDIHQQIASILLIAFCLLLISYFFLYNKNKFYYFIEYLSLTRIIQNLLLLNFGILIALSTNYFFEWSFFNSIFVLLANILLMLLWILIKGINDYHDIIEDKISNKKNPYISSIIEFNELKTIYSVILYLILSISFLLNYEIFLLTMVVLSIGFIYSSPPIRLKKYVFIAHLAIGIVSGIVYLMGLFLIRNDAPLESQQINFFYSIVLLFSLIMHIKDLKDYKGDKKAKNYTLPTLLGLQKSKIVISLFILVSLFLINLIVKINSIFFPTVLCGIFMIFFINKKKYNETPIFLIFFIYILVFVFLLLKYYK